MQWYCYNESCRGHPIKYDLPCCGITPWVCVERAQQWAKLRLYANSLLPGCDNWGLELICSGHPLLSPRSISDLAIKYAEGEFVGDETIDSDFQGALQKVQRFRATMLEWLTARVDPDDRILQQLLAKAGGTRARWQTNTIQHPNGAQENPRRPRPDRAAWVSTQPPNLSFGTGEDYEGHGEEEYDAANDTNETGYGGTTPFRGELPHNRAPKPRGAPSRTTGRTMSNRWPSHSQMSTQPNTHQAHILGNRQFDDGIRVHGSEREDGDEGEVEEGEEYNEEEYGEENEGEQGYEAGDTTPAHFNSDEERRVMAESVKAANTAKRAADRRRAEQEAEEQRLLDEAMRESREAEARARHTAQMKEKDAEAMFQAALKQIEDMKHKEENDYAENRKRAIEVERAKQQQEEDEFRETMRKIKMMEQQDREEREAQVNENVRRAIGESVKESNNAPGRGGQTETARTKAPRTKGTPNRGTEDPPAESAAQVKAPKARGTISQAGNDCSGSVSASKAKAVRQTNGTSPSPAPNAGQTTPFKAEQPKKTSLFRTLTGNSSRTPKPSSSIQNSSLRAQKPSASAQKPSSSTRKAFEPPKKKSAAIATATTTSTAPTAADSTKDRTKAATSEPQRERSRVDPSILEDGTRELAPQHPWQEAEARLGLLRNDNDVLPGYTMEAAPGTSIECETE